MPIALRQDEWNRILRWSDHDKEPPDVIRRREYVQYLDATSKSMTKSWPNSVENVNRRNDELRRARREAAEAANTTFYKRYVKKKQEEQERLMHSARDTIFKNKDAPKLLLSAVIETVIQKEREEQLKFLAEQRRLKTEQKKRDDDEIIRKAKEWNDLVQLKKKRRFDANKQYQKEILEQAHEIAERNRIEYETELNLQKIDNIKADKEMDQIKQFEDDFKAGEKNRIWRDMQQAREELDARRRQQAARDQLDDRLIDVLIRARARINQRRQRTEKELREEKLRILDKISQNLESGDAARDAKEQAILEKAVKEKDAIAEARRQADAKRQAQNRHERDETRAQYLRDQAQALHEKHTMRQWEMMNRFKNAEIYEDFKEKLRQDKERKVKEYREDILKLWKEREDREAHEVAERRHFYGARAEHGLRVEDCRMLQHAAALLQEAAHHQRPAHALHKAIDRYCKMYRLYPMPDLPASQQEHFPGYSARDSSRPGDSCDQPEPPAPPPPPYPPGDTRDGLQDVLKKSNVPSISRENPKSSTDYKRQGRANGLQRRPSQGDVQLPPILVSACKTANCHCDHKQ